MGKSYKQPDFLNEAGERFTTTFLGNNSIFEFFIAVLTLSTASLTSEAQYPVKIYVGKPLETSHSQQTIKASMPIVPALYVFPSILSPFI